MDHPPLSPAGLLSRAVARAVHEEMRQYADQADFLAVAKQGIFDALSSAPLIGSDPVEDMKLRATLAAVIAEVFRTIDNEISGYCER